MYIRLNFKLRDWWVITNTDVTTVKHIYIPKFSREDSHTHAPKTGFKNQDNRLYLLFYSMPLVFKCWIHSPKFSQTTNVLKKSQICTRVHGSHPHTYIYL